MPGEPRAKCPFERGDLVAYVPTDRYGRIYKCEIGAVKSVDEKRRTAFVAYHVGDTCACTRFEDLLKVQNSYAVRALADRIEQLGHEKLWPLADGCEDWSDDGRK